MSVSKLLSPWFLLGSLVVVSTNATAQPFLYSIGTPPTLGNPILRIDALNGTTTIVGNSPTLSLGPASFDSVGQRLFFGTIDSAMNRTILYTFNVQTLQLSSVNVPVLLAFIEYDELSGTLLAVATPDEAGSPLLAVDTLTGSATTLFPTNAIVRAEAFDPILRRLFFASGASGVTTIWTVNVTSHAVTNFQTPGYFVFLGYDTVTNALIAVQQEFTYSGPLVSIDVSTGNVQTLLPNVGPIVGNGRGDPLSRHFFGRAFTAGTTTITRYDVATNAVTTFDVDGPLGFIQPAPAATDIPALGPASIIILAIMLALIGARAVRSL